MSAMRFRYRYGTNGLGGYRGKARLNRDRSRASRCHAQQTIDEYFDGDHERSEPRIRIGHRNEFLPSVGGTTADASATHEQLDLPLDERRQTPPSDAHDPAYTEPAIRLHHPKPVDDAPAADAATEATAVAPTERPRRAPYEWFADRRAARQKKFQRGHFLYGCAIGTAAAAMILVMLRVAFM